MQDGIYRSKDEKIRGRMRELIIRYSGELEALQREIGFLAEKLLGGYAVVRIPEENTPALLSAPEVLWTEIPARVYTQVTGGKRASCITSAQVQSPGLTGAGVLVAIIDSGIDYAHPDFRREDGSTRIVALWDQTAVQTEGGTPPTGYFDGVLYSSQEIDRELTERNFAGRGGLTLESDLSGHGTHVAGIAAGNGRASGGRYRGVAYESDLLVVKLGGTQGDPFPQTTNLMAAVDFCVNYAADLGRPLCINLSFGNSEGSHDGRSLLETYLDEVSLYGKVCICIGVGNEGTKGRHVGGSLLRETETVSGESEGEEEEIILFNVGAGERRISMGLWVNGLDEIEFFLRSPSGMQIQVPENLSGGGTAVKGYPIAGGTVLSFGASRAEVFVGEATPYRGLLEIGITLRGENGMIEEGTWGIGMRPVRILEGKYDIWMFGGAQSPVSRFQQPTPESTLTIPATARRPIGVTAYDGRTGSIAGFSGRGYPRGGGSIKPDLAAPGVEIVSCAPGGGYTARSGTSMATPFVTGAAALLMQWGIVEGNDPYLYGERLKNVLIKTARPLAGLTEYPNPYVGWGTLCLRIND